MAQTPLSAEAERSPSRLGRTEKAPPLLLGLQHRHAQFDAELRCRLDRGDRDVGRLLGCRVRVHCAIAETSTRSRRHMKNTLEITAYGRAGPHTPGQTACSSSVAGSITAAAEMSSCSWVARARTAAASPSSVRSTTWRRSRVSAALSPAVLAALGEHDVSTVGARDRAARTRTSAASSPRGATW
jgi:hypothetical protein